MIRQIYEFYSIPAVMEIDNGDGTFNELYYDAAIVNIWGQTGDPAQFNFNVCICDQDLYTKHKATADQFIHDQLIQAMTDADSAGFNLQLLNTGVPGPDVKEVQEPETTPAPEPETVTPTQEPSTEPGTVEVMDPLPGE